MKKLRSISLTVIVFAFLTGLSTTAQAGAVFEVYPQELNFGEVEINTPETETIYIANVGDDVLRVVDIYFLPNSSSDFSIPDPPSLPLDINRPVNGGPYFVELDIRFSPSVTVYSSAVLRIEGYSLTNPNDGLYSEVLLEGEGTEETAVTIDTILKFFYDGVDAGTIEGVGPGTSAQTNHVEVFERNLLMVAFFIENGADREACTLLWHAYDRSDGQEQPKDFIKGGRNGDDVPELNTMILQLIIDLGCE